MRNLLIIGAIAAAAGAAPAFAQDAEPTPAVSFSGNVAVTSDYVFRGISQSNSDMALQGGFDLTTSSGFYAGTWLSSIDFNDASDANVEWDVYAGYTGSIGSTGLSYNVGVYGYLYPDVNSSADFDFYEVYGGLSYAIGNFTVGGTVNYSPDFFAGSGDAIYTQVTAGYTINDMFSLSGGVGYQTIDDAVAFGTNDYTTWNVGGTVALPGAFKGTSLDLRYSDTDDKGFGNLSDGRVIFTLKKAL
ncbi:MAG: hypothetical protein GC155_18695 [Alphaproteobacteria bacterium]|nr:hypothetical protein [Alphaproteobacteria bacterium]